MAQLKGSSRGKSWGNYGVSRLVGGEGVKASSQLEGRVLGVLGAVGGPCLRGWKKEEGLGAGGRKVCG